MKTIGLLLVSLMMIAGCADKQFSSTGAVNTDPLTIDQAMQTRSNWEPAMAQYENGDIPHNAVGFAYTVDPTIHGYANNPKYNQYNLYWEDTAVFILNSVTSPYTYYKTWGGVTSTGVQLPPTYTAVPPLPPEMAAASVEMPATTEATPTGADVIVAPVDMSTPTTQP